MVDEVWLSKWFRVIPWPDRIVRVAPEAGDADAVIGAVALACLAAESEAFRRRLAEAVRVCLTYHRGYLDALVQAASCQDWETFTALCHQALPEVEEMGRRALKDVFGQPYIVMEDPTKALRAFSVLVVQVAVLLRPAALTAVNAVITSLPVLRHLFTGDKPTTRRARAMVAQVRAVLRASGGTRGRALSSKDTLENAARAWALLVLHGRKRAEETLYRHLAYSAPRPLLERAPIFDRALGIRRRPGPRPRQNR
ncbi:hypothetical protein HRbin23_00409 [bacterium HR23]|nr:hypothetical protein HRbin23_00409 [bacterium HR23]